MRHAMHLVVASFALLPLACGAPSAPTPPPAAGAASNTAAAAPPVATTSSSAALAMPSVAASGSSVAASGSSAAQPEPEPVPALPPPAPDGVDKALWSMLAPLCPIAVHPEVKCSPDDWKKCEVVAGGKVTVGCRSWPRGWKGPDGRAPQHVGPSVHVGLWRWSEPRPPQAERDPPFLPVEAQFDGAFTRPGAKQKLVYFENCRRVDGMTITGCAAILEQRDGKWRMEGFQREANFSNCVKVGRDDGRDLLACHTGMGAMGLAIVGSLFYVDFAQPDETDHSDANVSKPTAARRTRIAALVHNGFDIRCKDVAPVGTKEDDYGSWSSGITHISDEKLSTKDVNRDGRLDLIIEFKRQLSSATLTAPRRVRSLCQRIRAGDPNGEGFLDSKMLLAKPTRFQLQFLNNGRRLVPTAGTRRVLKKWGGAPNWVW